AREQDGFLGGPKPLQGFWDERLLHVTIPLAATAGLAHARARPSPGPPASPRRTRPAGPAGAPGRGPGAPAQATLKSSRSSPTASPWAETAARSPGAPLPGAAHPTSDRWQPANLPAGAVVEAAAAARAPRQRRAPAFPRSAQAAGRPARDWPRARPGVAGTGGRWPPPIAQGAPRLPCSAGTRP